MNARSAVPTGKVKWYDADKGFGFLSKDDGGDVYVRASALPDGVDTLRAGARVEFGIVEGRRGDQALQVRLLEPMPSLARARRKSAEEMSIIVEDTIRLLDGMGGTFRHDRHPDARTTKRAAALLRALADELDV